MPTKRSAVRSRSLALRLTPKLRAVLSRIVARAKRSIVADVKDGTVPRSVRTIGGLGEYVDQNVYFLDAHGDFDPEVEALAVDLGSDGVDSQPMYDFLTLAMDRVEAWMKTGALKRIPAKHKATTMRGKVTNPSSEYIPADVNLDRAEGSFVFGGKKYHGEAWEYLEAWRHGHPFAHGLGVTTYDGIAWIDGKVYRMLSHDWENGEIVVSGLAHPTRR